MNRTLTDPTLRTFRQPLAHRLRVKLDELRDEIEARDKTIRKHERRISELETRERQLDKALVQTRIQLHTAEQLILHRNGSEGVTRST